jgi:Cu+-exporting ATPase
MFSFFKPKAESKNAESVTLKLSGLHCTSCAVNIDLTLEDLPGVIKSTTNYQKSESVIRYDSTKTNLGKIKNIITELGYVVSEN